MSCTACLLLEDGGDVLFERAASERRANASTTKMVTALVVARKAELDEEVRISASAAGVGEGGLDLSPGDRYSVEELLYALLLTSSNEASVALAEYVSGSEERFVGEMNELARKLGARDSHFVTPHGLDAEGHYASAEDLATFARHLLDDPLLRRIVATVRVRVEGGGGEDVLENRNLLVGDYDGAIGVKTGFTSDAGNVLVAAAEREGRLLIAVVMDAGDPFADARKLLDYGFATLRAVLLARGEVVADLIFDDGAISVEAGDRLEGLVPPSIVRIRFEVAPDLELPVSAGRNVGTIVVMHRGRAVGEVPALAAETAPAPGPAPLRSLLTLVLSTIGAAAAALAGRT